MEVDKPVEVDDVTLLRDSKGAPEKGASMASCVLNLCNTIMGTGILALPYALSGTGTVLGAVFLILSGSTCVFSLHLLSESARTVGRPVTFYSICEAAYPRLSLAVDIIIVFNGFLACETFLIVAGDSFSKLFVGGPSRQVWTLVTLACVAPLSLLKRLDALKFTSALSVAVLLLISTIVILFSFRVNTPLLEPCASDAPPGTCHGLVVSFGQPVGVVRSFATFVVAFTCQQNIFNCTNEMRDPTPRRCLQMIMLSIALASILYAFVGYAGYATFGDAVKSDILETYPQDNGLVFTARLGIALVVITCYPLQAFALRMSVGTLMDAFCLPSSQAAREGAPPNSSAEPEQGAVAPARESAAGVPAPAPAPDCAGLSRFFVVDSRSVGTVVALLTLNTGLAMVVHKLGLVVDINGSLAGTSITFIVPGAVYYLLHPGERETTVGKLAKALVIVGAVLVPVSLTAAFLPSSEPSSSTTTPLNLTAT